MRPTRGVGYVLDVKRFETTHHDLGGEAVTTKGATRVSHGPASLRIESEGHDGVGERRDVAGPDKDACPARDDDFGRAVEVVSDGRTTGKKSLREGAR